MPNNIITINGIPLSNIGVTMLVGDYAELLTPPPLKDFIKNDDPTRPGTDVIVNNPVVSERDLTLTFLIKGEDKNSFLSNYKAFVTELHKGKIELYIPDLKWYFNLLYRNSTQFENYRLNACKLAIKFNEPNPTYRISEGSGVLLTKENLALTTRDGEVFYLAQQYQLPYTGSRIDNILTVIKNELPGKENRFIYDNVFGTTAVLNIQAGHEYLCGIMTSIYIESVENSSQEAIIRFTSGRTKTELSWPKSLQIVGKIEQWVPTYNTTYEINIKNNIAVMIEYTQANEANQNHTSTADLLEQSAADAPLKTVTNNESLYGTGQYNSIYTGPEIDHILTEAEEQIPQKADKPVIEKISGTDATINVRGGYEYQCSTLTTLTIQSSEISVKETTILFKSGEIATQVTWPDSMNIIGYRNIIPNMTYEINIKNNDAIIIYAG